MALTAGITLGGYEVLSAIGAGGMGEVYRARDLRLGREVAIKVLPEALLSDPDRVARFEREAKVLASLNHPHIAALYGMEVVNPGASAVGQHVLVMELVEGETLAARLRRGPIPLEQTLRIAIQIADALEAAHEKGVVHRDLKPANVNFTPDGKVKVLDFGLAKALERDASGGPTDLTHSPTVSVMGTGAGVIVGTASYMSPEQAKGSLVDHRSDLFSFGAVLYEMLTGRQPFAGDSAPEILASVLAREPDFTQLPPQVNPRLRELLRRCFEKVPRNRWQAAGDLRADLEALAAAPRTTGQPERVFPHQSWTRRAAPLLVVAAIAAASGAGAVEYMRPSPPAPMVSRFSLAPLPVGIQFNFGTPSIDISRDGSHIAYAASSGLYVRSMSDFDGTQMIPATPTVSFTSPAFSPDGRSIAFVSEGLLKRIPTAGGTPFTIGPLKERNSYGISWEGDEILIGGASAITSMSASGGQQQPVLRLNPGEWASAPHRILGGAWILFTLAKGQGPDDWDAAQIVAQSSSSTERRVLIENGRWARYLASGHIVFARGGVLFAAPLDTGRMQLTAPPMPVADGIRRAAVNGISHFTVSDTGSLVYMPGPPGFGDRRVELVMADRNGRVERVLLPPGPYDHPRVSPDGTQVTFGTVGADQNIWIADLAGVVAPRRLTFTGKNRFPIWSDDGRRIVYQSDRDGSLSLYAMAADGTGTPERLTTAVTGTTHIPEAWLPHQAKFLFSMVKDGRRTLWTYSLGDRTTTQFDMLQTAMPRGAAISPDGKWLAYTGSVETGGATEGVYVEPVPATGATYQISERKQGQMPVWSRDGREVIFIPGGGTLAAVRIAPGTGLTFSTPTPLRRGFTENLGPVYERNYDVTSDGKFIGFTAPGQADSGAQAGQLNVVLNWFEELNAKMPLSR